MNSFATEMEKKIRVLSAELHGIYTWIVRIYPMAPGDVLLYGKSCKLPYRRIKRDVLCFKKQVIKRRKNPTQFLACLENNTLNKSWRILKLNWFLLYEVNAAVGSNQSRKNSGGRRGQSVFILVLLKHSSTAGFWISGPGRACLNPNKALYYHS